MRTLVWFRGKDLRVADHLPLQSALDAGEVVPLFVLDPYFFAPERAAKLPHRIQFLLESLSELRETLGELGSRLVVVPGKSVEVVPRLAREWQVDRVVAERWVEPFARERDRRVRAELGVPFELFEGETLAPPGTLRTSTGSPYSVYTPFSRAFARAGPIAPPIRAPRALPPLPAVVRTPSVPIPTLRELGLPENNAIQRGGERAARQRLERFLAGPASEYHTLRDRVDVDGTSRLSADLKFGTLSPRTVWHAVAGALDHDAPALRSFHNELVWREFTHSTLFDRPELLKEPFRPEWRRFPWRNDPALARAWSRGETGYPLIDAGARQLEKEGFVPNRLRMITASFLTKHLLVDYRWGEAHYLTFLTDGDWAQNNAGWQWSAGAGADAQPYYRVFNPITQGERFDPAGDYVRRYLPELAGLPANFVHRPWDAPPSVLQKAGVRLGRDYPLPVVDHGEARALFLELAKRHLRPPAAS